MPIDHDGMICPADKHEEVISWYLAALKPLGYQKLQQVGPGGMAVGLGVDGKPDWWIIAQQEGMVIGSDRHVAFTSPDKATVDAFHSAGIAAGGKCNGAPGFRPQYHSTYYGAFVKDPLGNNIEAVHHGACEP